MKKTPKKSDTEQLESLRRRLWLTAQTWRGDAARRELIHCEKNDSMVNALHNCAMDVDQVLARGA
jgi:hypothetical protein